MDFFNSVRFFLSTILGEMQAFWKFDIHLVWWVASLRFMALILSWALGCEMTASLVGGVRGTSSLTSVAWRSADWTASSHVSWEHRRGVVILTLDLEVHLWSVSDYFIYRFSTWMMKRLASPLKSKERRVTVSVFCRCNRTLSLVFICWIQLTF